MNEELKKRRDERAAKFVDSEICYGGLEYPLSGNTNKECVRSYEEGFNAAIQAVTEMLEFSTEDAQAKASSPCDHYVNEPFVEGARWQHSEIMKKLRGDS